METEVQPQLGIVVDQVSLAIDYHIIEHFSKHLYSSPYKAIEELVVNGYDAGADWVKVYLPGETTSNMMIWDDGASMTISGLKHLWLIANSPKRVTKDRTINGPDGKQRKIIGKFGIGKIASYTVGDSIAHLCKSDEGFLLVEVDYRQLMDKETEPVSTADDEGDDLELSIPSHNELEKSLVNKEEISPDGDKKPYITPIYELTEDEAHSYLLSKFHVLPTDFNENFRAKTWTVAIIDEIKRRDITAPRLRWVLGNGMPLQPTFKIQVNDDLVKPHLIKKHLAKDWNFGQVEIIDHLKSKWEDFKNEGKVSGDLIFGANAGLNPENLEEEYFVKFPSLGIVWGQIRLYTRSLLDYHKSDEGRSHGFFIMVRGRLINIDNEKFFLNDPSFSTFYSSQFVLHVDGLDEELLADRERVQEDSEKVTELIILQKAVYLAVAAQQRKLMLPDPSEAYRHILPVSSPELFMDPLAALWIRSGSVEALGFDFKEPKVQTKPLGKSEFVANFSAQDGFNVNSEHPYYQNLRASLGGGKKAVKALREFEIIAISEMLFEGHLFEVGLTDDQIRYIMKWRDDFYRRLASRDVENPNQLAEKLMEASYKSGQVFENALVEVLNTIGFNAERDGAKGVKDVFVKAYCGNDSYTLTFEAKALTTPGATLINDSAEIGGAANHRDFVKAEHAIIVARKFAGFDKPTAGMPVAIIGECQATKGVSIMEVDALIKLMHVVKEYSYSLDTIKEVFTTIESPNEKLKRIEALNKPLEIFDYAKLLQLIWDYQGQTGEGDLISIKHLWQTQYKKDGLDENELIGKLEALRTLVYPLVLLNRDQKEVALRQSPENIASLLQNKIIDL